MHLLLVIIVIGITIISIFLTGNSAELMSFLVLVSLNVIFFSIGCFFK